jgi:hypothetical protein
VFDDGKALSGSCGSTTATSCATTKITLDGASHPFTVKATNKPGVYSTTSSGSTWKAVGTPTRPGSAPSAEVRLGNGKVLVNGVTANSRGAAPQVQVSGGGQVSDKFLVSTTIGSSWSKEITLGDSANGVPVKFKFRMCNESGDCGGYSDESLSVTPFGEMSAISLATSKEGIVVGGSASADANGSSATLRITSSDGHSTTKTGTGNLNVDLGSWAANPNTDVTFTATLDSATTSPGRTTHRQQSGTVHTDSSTASWARGSATTGCSWTVCDRVNLQLRNYRANSQVVCAVGGLGGAKDWSRTFTVDGRGNWGMAVAPGLVVGDAVVGDGFGDCTQQ